MEHPHQRTLQQQAMHHKVHNWIQHVHAAKGPEIMLLAPGMYLQLGFSPKAA